MTNGTQTTDNPWKSSGLLLAAPALIVSIAIIANEYLTDFDHKRLKQGMSDQALDVTVRVGNAPVPIPLTNIAYQQREALLGTLKQKNVPELTLEVRDASGRIGCPVSIRATELKGLLENIRPTPKQVEKGLDLLASICDWSAEQLAAEKLKLTLVAPPVQAGTAPGNLVAHAAIQAPILPQPHIHAKS